MGTTTIDSRGVTIYLSDDEARAQAQELVMRGEQSLNFADARGYPLNDSDAARVASDLDEAKRLLVDIGDIVTPSGPVDLKRFVQPGWAEQELAARADAEARRREQTTRMAEAVRLIEQLAEEDWEAYLEAPPKDLDNGQAQTSERVNMKRVEDAAGVLYVVSGRGETKRFATAELAEREAKRRLGLA